MMKREDAEIYDEVVEEAIEELEDAEDAEDALELNDDDLLITPSYQSNLENGAKIIKSYVKHLSDGPGVYRMLDEHHKVLYVGKAKSLNKRVANYTRPAAQSLRIQRMISATRSMEFLLTANEVEALLLENNLIKRYRPPYNVLLRDDKTHLELFIRKDHDYPQISRHRGSHKQKGLYFGPYASASAVHQTMHLLERLFLVRNCSDSTFNNRKRPCLQYQIKRCSAPCVGLIQKADYNANINRAIRFLNGEAKAVTTGLEADMQEAALARDYERAGSLRDRIRALTQLQSEQDINGRIEGDADIIALAEINGHIAVQTLFYRGGRHNGSHIHYPKHEKSMDIGLFLTAFLGQLYQNITPPREILLSHAPVEEELLINALSEIAGYRVYLSLPQKGDKFKLMQRGLQNAAAALGRKLSGDGVRQDLLDQLGKAIGHDAKIKRVEVYDNSHFAATNPIGAMIVVGSDGFEKTSYRTFNIRKDMDKETAQALPVTERPQSNDDYAMMREVMTRRFSRLIKEIQAINLEDSNPANADRAATQLSQIPDIIMVDGGLGQLSAAQEALDAINLFTLLPNPPKLIAVAKGPDRNAGRERIFLADKTILELAYDSPLLYFIQRLRDEAHRFAIGTQRKRRKQGDFENPLDQIEGIGTKRRKQLMLHFGSTRAISGAGIADLTQIPTISPKLAQKIYEFFHPKS